MNKDCFREEDLVALMAGDASPDEWREHLDDCPPCVRLWSEQERVERAMATAFGADVAGPVAGRLRDRLARALGTIARPAARYDVWPDSPVGPLFLAVSERGLCGISFRSSEEAFVRGLARRGFEAVRAPKEVTALVSQLREYFSGRRRRFDVTVDLAGETAFQREVLEATAKVPAGRVVSYADIARAVGRPRATRAVGAALGQNPVPIVVPCHRVIGSDGGLHGYGGGLDIKEKLLRLEGALA